jgi:large subunit ribosomal protein L10
MSKYVKNLIAEDLRQRLHGVSDALLVNMVGLNANTNDRLRSLLREKHVHVMVVKNSLGARATVGTPLAGLFDGVTGPTAVCWGGEDIVGLAKLVSHLAGDEKFAPFAARGGVMDGERLSAEQVAEVARWPSREEQLARLMGQILGPGARLAAQLAGPAGALASQVAQRAKENQADAGQAGEGT